MADQKRQGDDDGVVTSAPSAKAGNLLGDMIASAKHELAEKSKGRETASERRAREEREAREREAAVRRAQAQESLNEAARLRNEQIALAEKARVAAEPSAVLASKTAQHVRPEAPAGVAQSVSSTPPRVVEKPVSKLLLAALVIVGVGVGLGSAFALMPSPRQSEMDVGGAARALVAATSKATAATEQRVLELAGKELAELKRQYGEIQAEQKRLSAELEQARKDLEVAREEAKQKPDAKPIRKTGNGTGMPTLKPGIF
jgi:hypothetical protein